MNSSNWKSENDLQLSFNKFNYTFYEKLYSILHLASQDSNSQPSGHKSRLHSAITGLKPTTFWTCTYLKVIHKKDDNKFFFFQNKSTKMDNEYFKISKHDICNKTQISSLTSKNEKSQVSSSRLKCRYFVTTKRLRQACFQSIQISKSSI